MQLCAIRAESATWSTPLHLTSSVNVSNLPSIANAKNAIAFVAKAKALPAIKKESESNTKKDTDDKSEKWKTRFEASNAMIQASLNATLEQRSQDCLNACKSSSLTNPVTNMVIQDVASKAGKSRHYVPSYQGLIPHIWVPQAKSKINTARREARELKDNAALGDSMKREMTVTAEAILAGDVFNPKEKKVIINPAKRAKKILTRLNRQDKEKKQLQLEQSLMSTETTVTIETSGANAFLLQKIAVPGRETSENVVFSYATFI